MRSKKYSGPSLEIKDNITDTIKYEDNFTDTIRDEE